jgi:lycopene cyclase domain-containing protein
MQEISILIAIFLITIFLKYKFKEGLYKTRKQRILINVLIFITMMSWEFLSHYLKIWLYPGKGMIGLYILGLPIEIYIFYIVLPDFVFTVYELIRMKTEKSYTQEKS